MMNFSAGQPPCTGAPVEWFHNQNDDFILIKWWFYADKMMMFMLIKWWFYAQKAHGPSLTSPSTVAISDLHLKEFCIQTDECFFSFKMMILIQMMIFNTKCTGRYAALLLYPTGKNTRDLSIAGMYIYTWLIKRSINRRHVYMRLTDILLL